MLNDTFTLTLTNPKTTPKLLLNYNCSTTRLNVFYIATPLADRLQKTHCATIARQQPRDTAVLSIYSRPMATATNRNGGVAVKDKYNV